MATLRPTGAVQLLPDGRRRLVFTVPAVPPSLNDWTRAHWRRRYQLTADWVALLRAATVGIPVLAGRQRVTVRYQFTDKRHRDLDNLVPKFILDGLKKRVIADDNEESVGQLVIELERGSAVLQTVITIEPLDA